MMMFSFLHRHIFIGSIRVSSDYYFLQFHNVPSFILIVSPSLPFSQKGIQYIIWFCLRCVFSPAFMLPMLRSRAVGSDSYLLVRV